MNKPQRSKFTDRFIQVVIGALIIFLGYLLISANDSQKEIKKNSDQVPELKTDVGYCKARLHCIDSLNTVRYILDTSRSGDILRKVDKIERVLRHK